MLPMSLIIFVSVSVNQSSHRKKQLQEMRRYELGEPLDNISISQADIENGSPKEGDMIARNPQNHNDMWLVAQKFFEDNYEEMK